MSHWNCAGKCLLQLWGVKRFRPGLFIIHISEWFLVLQLVISVTCHKCMHFWTSYLCIFYSKVTHRRIGFSHHVTVGAGIWPSSHWGRGRSPGCIPAPELVTRFSQDPFTCSHTKKPFRVSHQPHVQVDCVRKLGEPHTPGEPIKPESWLRPLDYPLLPFSS